MKRLLAAALALSLSTPALAAMQEVRSGAWTTFGGLSTKGVPTCGMSVSGRDRNFYIKYQSSIDSTAIYFQMYRNTWHFGEGNDVPMKLGFDNGEPMLSGSAVTYGTPDGRGYVEFHIEGKLIGDFLHEFGEANKMWIRFDSGTEDGWVADMAGSRKAMQMFLGCISKMEKPTQPFGESKAQPAPTQPFGDKKVPTTPVKPTAKKDDGSV